MREIPLTQGLFVMVDDSDHERVSRHKWTVCGGYPARTVKGGGSQRTEYLHRWLIGAAAGVEVDHINGNKLDARRVNLRACAGADNACNRPKRGDAIHSKWKGVSPNPGSAKFNARIWRGGVSVYLGTFDSEVDAARAYDAAARRLFGEFAWLNFPDDTREMAS